MRPSSAIALGNKAANSRVSARSPLFAQESFRRGSRGLQLKCAQDCSARIFCRKMPLDCWDQNRYSQKAFVSQGIRLSVVFNSK